MRPDEGYEFRYSEYHDSGIKGGKVDSIFLKTISYDSRDIGPKIQNYKALGTNLDKAYFVNSTWASNEVGNSDECRLACYYGNKLFTL